MALTKSIQSVFEGSPVSGTYKPVASEATTLITEITDGTIGVLTFGQAAHASGTLALAFATKQTATVTPTALGTFTTTVPPAGTICTLIILTSGASSYTMTFGTGFKSTGTLATGVTTGKYFTVSFISNGTLVIETSRTTAM